MKLMLLGYFGFGNAGDEAILAAELSALRGTLGTSTEFVAVSGDPTRTTDLHGIPALARTDVAALLRTLRSCDGLVAGGGSLLQDVTSARPVAFYGGLMLAARSMRTPVFVYAQGLGPLRRRANRALAGAALRSARYVAVRDPGSLALAARLGVRGLDLVPDPALGMDLDPEASTGADPEPATSAPRLAVALRPWPGSDGSAGWLPVVRAVLVELARDTEVVLVPFHAGQDLELARALAAEVPGASVVEPDAGYRAAYRAIAGADAVLGMRLHAVVMAAAAGVPFAALSYDPKVAGFADQVGQPVAASVPGPVDQDAVVQSVTKALEGPDEAYLERVALLRAEARKPAHEIARLLQTT